MTPAMAEHVLSTCPTAKASPAPIGLWVAVPIAAFWHCLYEALGICASMIRTSAPWRWRQKLTER
jgi:hypothetical protein